MTLSTTGRRGAIIAATPKLDDCLSPDDNTDLNASTTAHGLLLKATAPAAGLVNVVGITNGETAYANKALFDATTPAALGTAATGSATVAARRDHVHALQTGLALDTALEDHSVRGITITRRADAATTLFDAGYIKSDGDIAKAKADAAGTVPALLLASAAIDSEANGSWLLWGIARDDTWNWTVGGPIYVSAATAGALTQTKPTTAGHQVQIVGYAITADIIFWCPNSTIVEVV